MSGASMAGGRLCRTVDVGRCGTASVPEREVTPCQYPISGIRRPYAFLLLFLSREETAAARPGLTVDYPGEMIMETNTPKLLAIAELYDVARRGADHQNAISYGGSPDCFEHMFVLRLISDNRAEALRIHRELVAEELIAPPRQTSRTGLDGVRRHLQVQRLYADRLYARLAREDSDVSSLVARLQGWPY